MRISDWSSDVCSSDLQDGADIRAHIAEIIRSEHQAEEITREVLFDVRRVFVTPFDRSAIIDLIGTMDDAIDQMNATGKSIELYELTSFEPQMRDMTGIIVEAARVTAEAIPLLRRLGPNAQRLHELTSRLIQLEGHADERSEEHTSELQSLMRISYAVFCLKKQKKNNTMSRNKTIHKQRKADHIKTKHRITY